MIGLKKLAFKNRRMVRYALIIFSVIAAVPMSLLVFSFAFFYFDGRSAQQEVSDLPPYYQQLVGAQCARVFPAETEADRQECCMSSIRQMVMEDARLAPLAFTDNPTRGCPKGFYNRMQCDGSMVWCDSEGGASLISNHDGKVVEDKDGSRHIEVEQRYVEVIGNLSLLAHQSSYATYIRINKETEHHMTGRVFFKDNQSKSGVFYATDRLRTGEDGAGSSESEWIVVQNDLKNSLRCETADKYGFPEDMRVGCVE